MVTLTLDARNRVEHDRRHEAILGQVRALRTAQLALGRLLREMDATAAFLLFGASNFPTYCEQVGLAAFEGRELAALGEGAAASDALGAKVLEGRVTVPAAAAVGRVLRDPALLRPGDRWLEWAERESTRDVRNRVKKRLEEARAGAMVFPLTVYLSPKGADDFLRCRELTIRKAGRPLTEGQTFEVVVDDYLGRHDGMRRVQRGDGPRAGGGDGRRASPGTASPSDTAGTVPGGDSPRSRHVPAGNLREVLSVAGDCCRVEGCDHRSFLQNCHLRAFAAGGGNAAANLVRLCREHHVQLDSGTWRPASKRDGSVVMIDRRGVVVGRFRDGAPSGAGTGSVGPAAGEARPPP